MNQQSIPTRLESDMIKRAVNNKNHTNHHEFFLSALRISA